MIHHYTCPGCLSETEVPITKIPDEDEYVIEESFWFICELCGCEFKEEDIIKDFLLYHEKETI